MRASPPLPRTLPPLLPSFRSAARDATYIVRRAGLHATGTTSQAGMTMTVVRPTRQQCFYSKALSLLFHPFLFFGAIHAARSGHRKTSKAGGVGRAESMRTMYHKPFSTVKFPHRREPTPTLEPALGWEIAMGRTSRSPAEEPAKGTLRLLCS